MTRLNVKKLIFLAVCVAALALFALAGQPLLTPERAPLAAPDPSRPSTLTGRWANESRDAYVLADYRPDGTFEVYVQPKTLYGRMFVGNRRMSGRWEQKDAGHVEVAFGPARPSLKQITFDGPDAFTVAEGDQRWRRVASSP